MTVAEKTSRNTTSPPEFKDPLTTYQERLESRNKTMAELDQIMDRLGLFRLLVFALGLVLAWLVFVSNFLHPAWMLVPIGAFLILVIRYNRIWLSWKRANRAARYYQFGIDRLQDKWHGRGNRGDRFLQEDHLYAADLDLFGKGTLFERLCIARTSLGEETLAGWLLNPAVAEEILARQKAVRDLRGRLDLREDLATLKAEVPPVDFAHLLNWGKQPPDLPSARLRWFILILSVTNVVTVLGWLLAGFTSIPFAVSVCLSVAVCLPVIKQVNRILKPIEKKGQDLFLLSSLLHRVEDEPFTASLLKESQTALQVEGFPPSKQIGDLAFRVDWLHAMQNQFFLPLALLLMWRFQMAFALEAWRKKSGPAIEKWLQALGQIEALSSLAGYSFENPEDPFPEILSGPPCYEGEDLGHPLLPKTDCVHNDVNLTDSVHLLVVSGSNMSGKSTLLRTVGTNAVLALAGGPVCGKSLRLTPLQIGATLRVQDSLLGGRSRFFAEISKIRKILDRRKGSLRVLFLLDELFHGTNSHDRRIGAAALLKSLLEAGCIGLVTTHDLSLTEITAKVGEHAQNVHFADQFVDGEMHFDYKMRPGVVPHSNALALMRAIGLDV